jgi:NADH dehydrogenase
VVIRPSIVFGQGDSFFTRFAGLARALPVLPLAGAETRFQPVFVGDVAEVIAKAVDGTIRPDAPTNSAAPISEPCASLWNTC